MDFTPVIIVNLLLLIITILLAIADKLLVSYGDCKITIHQEGEKKEFTVEGGSFLLTDLTSNDIKITSSCAGKASCGYCKVRVLEGGGAILPTEEIFMSREEKHSGTRLACQVKVKNDMEIFIPDFLTTVKTIVKNKSYDPKLRWQFTKEGREEGVQQKPLTKLSHEDKHLLRGIFEEHKDMAGSIVPVLQKINSTYNCLPEPVLRFTAKNLHMPESQIYRIATFYNTFSLEPRGKNIVKVCLGTACYVKGGEKILHAVRSKLGLKDDGDTTKDMNFSVETVSCIGCCGQSPVISINDDIFGYVKPSTVGGILGRYA